MDPRIQEILNRLAEVSDEALEEVEGVLKDQLEAAAEAKDVETARALADGMEQVRTEIHQRIEAAKQRELEIAEIMNRVNAQQDPDEAENNGSEGGEGEGDGGEGTDAGDNGEGEGDGDGAPNPDGSASSKPLPKIGDLISRRKPAASHSSRRTPERRSGTTVVTAATDVPGFGAGQEFPDQTSIAKAIVQRWEALSGTRGLTGRVPVARVTMEYPDERLLRPSDPQGNADKIRNLLHPQALVASGGICAPPAGFYDTNTLATADRPLRNSLPVFGADRGGIRFIPSVSLDAVDGAIGHITEAEDAAGGAGAEKPCLTITCESAEDVVIAAISRCLQFGNFNARTHPEYVTHLTDLTLAAWARTAEQILWDGMCTAGTAVTYGTVLSAWRDFYAAVGTAVAGLRSRHRMSDDAIVRVAAPSWLASLFSIDIARQAPGDDTAAGRARASFENALLAIGARITWTKEGGAATSQVFAAQSAGALVDFADEAEILLYPEGSFLFLDGGTLDLGVVRDSTLNVTNDFQLFAESFENVAFLGPEAYCLTVNVCPSGLTSGSTDAALACVGS